MLFRCRDISPYRSSTKSENRSQVNFLTKISRDPGSLFLPMLHKTKTRLRLSIPDASKAVYLLTPTNNKSRIFILLLLFVGVPRIELGPYVPKTYILPIYYTPLQCLQILSQEGKRKKPSLKIGTALNFTHPQIRNFNQKIKKLNFLQPFYDFQTRNLATVHF
ncbi:MAG: hypothetical protein QG594_665 [Bacteroidota bacterium]|nr:hypothetical protein [Bacteroidota bacterium]